MSNTDLRTNLSECSITTICDEDAKPEDTFHASFLKHKLGQKFRDPFTKQSIAVIFTYTYEDGRVTRSIRMLRVADIIYNVTRRHP